MKRLIALVLALVLALGLLPATALAADPAPGTTWDTPVFRDPSTGDGRYPKAQWVTFDDMQFGKIDKEDAGLWQQDGAEGFFQIRSKKDLLLAMKLTGNAQYANKDFILLEDIDMNGQSFGEAYASYYEKVPDEELDDSGKAPMLNFGTNEHAYSGHFWGDGHTIKNVDYSKNYLEPKANTGLFNTTKGAEIRDLNLENFNVVSTYIGGLLVGHAEGTKIYNVTITNSNFRVEPGNNVLVLATDGGAFGGALVGWAVSCVMYNCGTKDTNVRVNNTMGVGALSGKGLYVGGLVGQADECQIEYCRCERSDLTSSNGKVSNYYDVAIGALGGYRIYSGGIAGKLSHTEVTDCFATNHVYFYCATYVSVGAGNVGCAGGIAAISQGGSTITRSHFSGTLESRQYNAALVIPIIQDNVNLSGLVQTAPEELTVADSYFNQELVKTIRKMGVAGDSKHISGDSGPQNLDRYQDRSFWEGQGYDFMGTADRKDIDITGSYDEVYHNKWVMDKVKNGPGPNDYVTIPVHGKSTSVTFDFPGAGTAGIQSQAPARLHDEVISTADPYKFARLAMYTNEGDVKYDAKGTPTSVGEVKLTFTAANADYRFVNWYKDTDVGATGLPAEDTAYFETLRSDDKNIAKKDGVNLGNPAEHVDTYDNDLFMAHAEGRVTFHNLAKETIDAKTGDPGGSREDDWYAYKAPLPQVEPTGTAGVGAGAKLIGWTTDTTKAYGAITSVELKSLKDNEDFFQTGEPIEKAMELYPVYANLILNAQVQIEGHDAGDPYTRAGVGKVSTSTDAAGNAVLKAEPLPAGAAQFPEGYRFLGWYEVTGDTAYRISTELEHTLVGVDLTEKHIYEARFEYLVDYYVHALESSGSIYEKADPVFFTSRWHKYNETLIEVKGPDYYRVTFTHWGAEPQKDLDVLGEPYAGPITQPQSVYAQDTKSGGSHIGTSLTGTTDFPGGVDVILPEYSGLTTSGYVFEVEAASQYYHPVFYTREAHAHSSHTGLTQTSAELHNDPAGSLTYKSEKMNMDTMHVRLLCAHAVADVIFHQVDPATGADTPATVTRRYDQQVFLDSDTTTTYTYLDPANPVEGREHVAAASPAARQYPGYYFAGWVDADALSDDEVKYVFRDGDPTKGIGTTLERVTPYLLKEDAVVRKAMPNVYPVYLPYDVTTRTTVALEVENVVQKPTDPEFTPKPQSQAQVEITVTAYDKQPVDAAGTLTYTLTAITVSEDGGEPVELENVTKNDNNTWTAKYTVKPGVRYVFTAVYLPYVVAFHRNGDQDAKVLVRNHGDTIGEMVYASAHTARPWQGDLDGTLFVGWTHDTPADPVGKPYFKVDNATYTDKEALLREVEGYKTVAETSAMIVTQSLELWPVYAQYKVNVISNLDENLPAGYTAEDVRMALREQEMHKDGLHVELYAKDLYKEGYRFDGWYLNGVKITDQNTYDLSGEEPFAGNTYEARYTEVFRIVYHAVEAGNETDGPNVLHVTELSADELNQKLVSEKTVSVPKMEGGKPVLDANGDPVMVEKPMTVPLDPEPEALLQEQLGVSKVLAQWMWVKDGNAANNQHYRTLTDTLDTYLGHEAGKVTEMHLYPRLWTLTVLDADGREISLDGSGQDKSVTAGLVLDPNPDPATGDHKPTGVGVYFNPTKPYTGQKLTVVVERNTWIGNAAGDNATKVINGIPEVPVTLYTTPEIPQGQDTPPKFAEPKNTDANGVAEFQLNIPLDSVDGTRLGTYTVEVGNDTVNAAVPAGKTLNKSAGGVYVSFPASAAETKYTGAVKGYQLSVYKTGTWVARKEIAAGDAAYYDAATGTYSVHVPAATSGMVPTTGAADGAVYTVSVTARPAIASYKDSQAVSSTAPVAGGRVELTTANLAGPKGTAGSLTDGTATFPTVTFDNTDQEVAVSYKVAVDPPLPTTENAGAMTVSYKRSGVAAAPKDAGDYDVYVNTAGGSYYLPLAETKVGTFKIEKSTTHGVDINIPVPGTKDDPATPDADESKPGRPATPGDENPSYDIETKWTDSSNAVVEPDDPVKPGETYKAEVTLTPKDGYQFPDDPANDLDLTINGTEPTGHTVTKEGETVKIVYTFPATKPGTPVITVGAESFRSGKVAKITTQSAQEVQLFYYGKTTEDAMLPSAVEAAATKTVRVSPAAGTTDVVWDNTDAAAMTTLSPNTTYYVFAVAKVGDTYSEVAKASFKTPYQVTIAAGEGADRTAGKMDESVCKDYSVYAEGQMEGNALAGATGMAESLTVTAYADNRYAFKVWTTSNDDGGERAAEAPLAEVTWDAATLVYTIQPNSKRHVTLTATFEPIYHAVYDANGGTVAGGSLPEDNTVYKRADKITVQALAEGVTLTKPGYTFEGWTGEPDPNEGVRVFKPNEFIKMSDAIDRAKLNPGETFTLYAVWKAKELKFNEAGGGNPIDIGQGKTNEHNMGPDAWTGYALDGLVTGGTGDYTYEMVRLATGNYPDFLKIGTINDAGTEKPAIVLNTRLGCAKDYAFGVKITDRNSKKSVQGTFTLTVTKQTPVIDSFDYDSGAGNVPGTAVVNKTKIKAKVVDKYQADKVLYDSTGTETNTSGGVWVADPATFASGSGTYNFKFQVTGEHAGDFNEASDDTKTKVSLTAASKETDVAITDETDGTTGMSMDYHKTVTVKYGYDAIPAVTVTVNNTGTVSNLTLAIASDNADFVVSPDTASVNVGGKVTFTMTVPQGKPVGTHTAKVTVTGTDSGDPSKTVTGTYTYDLIVEPAEISAALVRDVTAPKSGETAADPTVADNDGYTVAYKWTETGKTEAVTAFEPGVSYTVSATFTATPNYKFVDPAGSGYQLQLTGADAPVAADQSDDGDAKYAISADGRTLTISKTFKALAPDNVTAQVKPEYDQITLEKMSGESGRRLDFYYLVVEAPEDGTLPDLSAEEIKQRVVDTNSRTDVIVKLSGLAHGGEPVDGVSTWDGTAEGNSTFKALDLEPNAQYKVLVAALAPEDGDMAVGIATAPDDATAVGADKLTITTPKALTVSASVGGIVTNEKYFKFDADPAQDKSLKGGESKTISIHQNETFTAKAKAAGKGWAFLHWDVDGKPKAEPVPGLKNESTYEYVHADAKNTSTLRAHFVKKLSGAIDPSGTPKVGDTVTIDPDGIIIGDKVYNNGQVSDMMQEEKIEILWQYKDSEGNWQPITRQDGQQNADGTTYAKGLRWKVWEGPGNAYLGKEIRAQLSYTYVERERELAKSESVYATFTDKVTKKLDKPVIAVSPAETDEDEDSTVNKGGLDATITPPPDAPEGTEYVVKVVDPADPDPTHFVREIITTGTEVNIPLVDPEDPTKHLDPTKEYKIEVVAKPPEGSGYDPSDPATATKDAKGGKLTPAKIPITKEDLDLDNVTDTAKVFNDRIQDARKEGLDDSVPLVSLNGALSGVDGLTVNVYYNPGNTVTAGQRHVGEYPIHVEVISTNPLYAGSDGVIDTGKTLTITQDKPTLKLNPPTAGSKRAERYNLGSVAVTATLSKPTPSVDLEPGEHYADANGVITEDRFTYSYAIKSVPAGYTNGAYTVGQELTDGFITPDDFGTWEIWVKPKYNGIESFQKDVALPDNGVFTLVVGRRVATAVTLDNVGAGGDLDNAITYGTSGKGYDASTAEKAKTWPLKGIKATFTYQGSDTPETLTANDKGEFLPAEGGEKLGVTWTIERGNATIENGAVKFTTAGNITLKLSYMNASATVDLTVEPRKVTGWHTTSDGKQTGGTKVYEAGNKSVPKPGMAFDAGVVLAGDDLSLSGLVDSDYELSTDAVGEASITVKDPTKVKLTGAQFGLYDLTGANQTWGKLTIQKKDDGGGQGGGGSGGGGSSGGGAPVPAPETKHSWYMKGYPDGSFAPDAKITRAEVATIIARSCLTGFVEGKNYGNPGHYVDIQGHWAASAISFCTSKKVLEGRGDGTFDPDQAITREELALVVARLQGVKKAGKLPFTDAEDIDPWALDGVYTAYAEGWIIGYEDGSFRPRRDIARCETAKIINGYLKRKVDAKGLPSDHRRWPDVADNHWAYYEIAEATHSHEFSRKNDKAPETWTEVK